MSDQKKLNKRLNDLFADLENDDFPLAEAEETLPGWTWEINPRGNYTKCSPEVTSLLGVSADDFVGKPLTTFRLAHESQSEVSASLEAKRPRNEITVQFLDADENFINVRMYLFYAPEEDGSEESWRGFTQLIQSDGKTEPTSVPVSSSSIDTVTISSLSIPEGIAIENDNIYSVSSPYSSIGKRSLELRQSLVHEATEDSPATLAVPVELQEQALGLLEFIDETPNRRWSREEQLLVEEVAGQLSLALENARLFEESQQRSQELAVINRVVSQVAASLDVNESMRIVTTELANALDVQVNIALLNPDGVSLTLVADYSPRQENPFVVGYEIPIVGNPSTERVFETKAAVIIDDPQTNPLISSIHDLMRSLDVQNMGIFPMIFQDEVYGTVGLYILDEGRTFTQGEIQLVNTILVQAATAVQNARLFEQIQTRSTQLLTAAEISRAASSILEPHPLITQAVNLIRERFNLYYTGIFLVDEDGILTGETDRWAVLRAGTGEAGRIQVERGHKLEIGGESMIGQCVSLAQAQISQVAPEEMHRFANPLLPDTQSEMALPLISRGKVIGAMTIQSTETGAFSEEGISVLQTMADQVANALQNANLFNQTQQNASELSILNDMSLELSHQLDVNEIINTVYQYTSQLMDTTYFFVALYDSDTELISFPLVVENNETSQIPAMQKRKGLTQHVIDSKEPLLIYENVEQVIKDLGLEEIVVGEPASSWLGVPLLIGDEVLGVIATQNATRPRVFNNHHQDLMILVARQSAIALQNAQLFAQTQDQLSDLSTIQETTASLSAALTLDGVVNTLLSYLTSAIQADSASVFSIDGDKLVRMGVYPKSENSPAIGDAILLADYPLTQHVIEMQEPLAVSGDDPKLQEHAREAFKAAGIAANATIPIVGPEGVLGTISVSRNHPGEIFVESELNLMSTLANQAAVAILNARSYELVQQTAEDMSLLFDVSREITNAPLEVEDLARVVSQKILEVFEIENCSISLLDSSGKTLKLVADEFAPQSDRLEKYDPEVWKEYALADYPATARVIKTLQPAIMQINDPDTDPAELAYMKEYSVTTLAILPLIAKGEAIGVLELDSGNEQHQYNQDEINLAMTLANQAAIALDNARSYQRIQQAANEMSILFDVSRAISGAPVGVTEIAEVVARNFVGVLNIPECSISLHNPENNTLEMIIDLYAESDQREILREDQIGSIESLEQYPATARVMRALQPMVIHASDPDADPAELAYMKEWDVLTLAVLPLAVKGQAIGVIELESFEEENQYTESELNLAMLLANQAATALDNALLYEEQRKITEQLRELDSLKSQFLANMSHELRTPLNSIIGFSRVIMKGIDGPVTELQTQDLSAIYNAGQHLLNMINDILDISKIEAGKMELAFEDIELPQIVESVLSTTRGLIKDKPVELRTDIQDGIPIIHADPTRIRQIMLNLLSNAAKFVDEGSITVAVTEQIGNSGRPEVRIAVIDTGVGIAHEDQQDLFEPFTQVDGSATRSTGGTGLGLSISRLLVDLHDGKIGVDSTPGEGSTFYFTIPILPEEKLTILSIDGDPQVTDLYQRYLEDTKYQIVSVLLPNDALKMALELRPFAITLDTNLPEHDGWEILQTLQNDLDVQDIPIVVCSLLDVEKKAMDAGAAGYLPKPILKDDLIKALNNIFTEAEIE
ncbi:MAG: GAF domain-containing protein [Anaerolineales bacterium]|nr:GAF domain-containing protein [Chloroflexota bacterium]MBL6979740.1 GAF domain-containing protein [Anaerolineales bacterium]